MRMIETLLKKVIASEKKVEESCNREGRPNRWLQGAATRAYRKFRKAGKEAGLTDDQMIKMHREALAS